MSGESRTLRSHVHVNLLICSPEADLSEPIAWKTAAVAAPLAAPASTSRSRSRPPRGAVGLGHFPEDQVATSRNLIESLARSLSRPRGRTSPPPRAPSAADVSEAAPAQTREEFIAANGGQPWGALGMGSPAASPSPSRSPRGRQATSTSVPRREWSVSRREWTQAGSTSPAAAVDVLVSSVGDLISTTTSNRSTPSSSRSQSPERRGRERAAALPEADAGVVEPKTSRSRSRSVLAKVRGIMRSSSVSPRESSSVHLPDVEDSELLLEKEAVVSN